MYIAVTDGKFIAADDNFSISRQSLPFEEAASFCESVNRQLIEFRNEEEYNQAVDWMLENFFKSRKRGDSFWTGMVAADSTVRVLIYDSPLYLLLNWIISDLTFVKLLGFNPSL